MDGCIEIEDCCNIEPINHETEDTESTDPQIIIGEENPVKVKICQDTDDFMVLELTLEDNDISETDNKHNNIETCGYVTTYLSEESVLAYREKQKKNPKYVDAKYKCETCIIPLESQSALDNHKANMHRVRLCDNKCKICQSYVPCCAMKAHMQMHCIKQICTTCGHMESNPSLAERHVMSHKEDVPAKKTPEHEIKNTKMSIYVFMV